MIAFAGGVRGRAERSEASGIRFRVKWRSERTRTSASPRARSGRLTFVLKKGADLVV